MKINKFKVLPMNKILRGFLSLIFIIVTFGVSQITQCMEEECRGNPSPEILLFKLLPKELELRILEYAAVVSLEDEGTIGKLSVICKNWQSLITQNKIEILTFAICEQFPVDQETCERFLRGRLTYNPQRNDDSGKIELRIADLVNPLEGKFDLSKFFNKANKALTISIGYPKKERPGNNEGVNIWFVPRFMVSKNINTTGSQFQHIFPDKWSEAVPVGIIWTWGSWDGEKYGYLTDQNMDELSSKNLYKQCPCTPQQRIKTQGKTRARAAYDQNNAFIYLSYFTLNLTL
jgi:hypothetical protein